MFESKIVDSPKVYQAIEQKSKVIGFTMPADPCVCSLLKTLISSKPGANILELGTGTGLSLSWMIDGMDKESKLVTIDNNPQLVDMVKEYFGHDDRIEVICADGTEWINQYNGEKFDLIFADAWPGKYSQIDEILALVERGGFYIVDDMMAQANWPNGHQDNVDRLINYLDHRNDFNLTKLSWSTGLIIAVRNEI